MSKVIYPNKNAGDQFTHGEANELKESINHLYDNPVVGSKGDKGETGEQGIQGVRGYTGAKGDKGDPGVDGITTDPPSERVAYTNGNITNVKEALDKLLYVMPVISAFHNVDGAAFEMGQTITPFLQWALNKEVVSQDIDGNALDVALREYQAADVSANASFVLTANDGSNAVNASAAISFYNRMFWLASANAAIEDADILASGGVLSGGRAQTRTFDCSGGKYFWFAWPTRFGAPSFKVGGLAFSAMSLTTRSFTNASGYMESYDIYRVVDLQTGTAISVDVF
jgi:hypothetical protein